MDTARERLEEIGWVVDHVADLDADFLAIYGIDDMLALPSVRWLRLAYRLAAFDGVMAARIRAEQAQGGDSSATAGGQVSPSSQPLTTGQIIASEAFSDVISMG